MASTNSIPEMIARLFEAVASSPLEQRWKIQLQRVEDVYKKNSEGRTLLQEAVVYGKLDWVQALLEAGADPEVGQQLTGGTVIELAWQMVAQHPGNVGRLAILGTLYFRTTSWHGSKVSPRVQQETDTNREESRPMTPRDVTGSNAGEHFTAVATDLSSLEDFLGVTLAACGRKAILPQERSQRLENTVERDGTTLLMKAAGGGVTECVELLLKCGSDVNASRTVGQLGEDHWQRAIDFAVEGGHHSVVLLLLRWDSFLPEVSTFEQSLKCMRQSNVNIQDFFNERDDFFSAIETGDLGKIEKIIGRNETYLGDTNHWADESGRSSLYFALYKEKYDAWAFLKSKKFQCLPSEVGKMDFIMESANIRLKINRAMRKYFIEVEDSHVYKMLSRTNVLERAENSRWTIEKIYKEAGKVPQAKLFLQYLQDEPHFEVIFDMVRSDITCMHIGSKSGVLGIHEPVLDRVYASASLESLPDVVSNLVHELAHKVMHVVFNNGGLPYKQNDREKICSYQEIASKIMEPGILRGCNDIIQRVKLYAKKERLTELIVRIPEIITKTQLEHNIIEGSDFWKNEHEQKLFDFYSEHVEPEIKKRVKANESSRFLPICEMLNYPALFSDHVLDDIQVDENMEHPKINNHHGIRFIQVTNLKLGVSHLSKALSTLVSVDWTKFQNSKPYFESGLWRGTFNNLAVVWDNNMALSFCKDPHWCERDCPAEVFFNHENYVTIVIPKEFVTHQDNEPIDYTWRHLSKKTKNWVKGRIVKFQGKEWTVQKMVESILEGEDVDESLNTLLDATDVSELLDQGIVEFGRNIGDQLEKRKSQLLRDLPTSFIQRKMKVRPVDLNETLIEQRTRDAVFICKAKEEDLRNAKIPNWRKWDGEGRSNGTRYFLLDKDLHVEGENNECKEICKQLTSSPAAKENWQFAHFFRSRGNKFDHLCSQCINTQRCQLLADVPGSGKSVIAITKALEEKQKHPERWVEFIELTEHEDVILQWNDSKSNCEDFLFQLINEKCSNTSTNGKLTLQKKIFKRICHTKEKLSLYVDGYDEICPDHSEKCSSFLETLLQRTSATLFLTTRTHECLNLESRLSIFAYNLIPLDKTEQVSFMNSTWNELLKSFHKLERDEKLKSIVSNVKIRCTSRENKEMVEKIEQLLGMDAIPDDMEINFNWLAEELIDVGKPIKKSEGYVSDIPLNTWMLASVCFKNSFILSDSLRHNLYGSFIDLKIEIYSREKAKTSKTVAVRSMTNQAAQSIRQLLKQFAASFFLPKDIEDNTSQDNINDMLRVGVLIKIKNSYAFIHRTFGEYLFSIWLLEEAKNKKVTKVFLSRVLLEEQFENVRKFIDDILLPLYENKSQKNEEYSKYKKILPNSSAFTDTLVQTIQHSLYKSIEECHPGILHYLAEFSGDNLADVLFGEADVGFETSRNNRYYCVHLDKFNAFTLCGDFTKTIHNSKEGRIESLKILQTLMMLTEKNGLLKILGSFISNKGLWWTGVYWRQLWYEKEVGAQFYSIFDFFLKHKDVLGEALKDKIMDEEGEWLFTNTTRFQSFDLLQRLLESILKESDFDKLLTPSPTYEKSHTNLNMVIAWTRVISYGTKEEVEGVWNYLKSKLTTSEKKKTFLRRKDYEGRNAFIAAFVRQSNDDVITYVLRLIEREFSQEEWKKLLRDSLLGENLFPVTSQTKDEFVESVTDVIRTEVLSLEEAFQQLRSKEKFGVPISTLFPTEFTLLRILKMQHKLTDATQKSSRGEMEKMVKRATGYLKLLSNMCFFDLHEIESPVLHDIRKGFNEILLPTLSSHFSLVSVPLNEDGYVIGVLDQWKRRVKGDSLMAFLELMRRQLKLESQYLATTGLKERMQRDWMEIYVRLPSFKFTEKTGSIWMTKSLLIQCFFDVLATFLSKNELSEVLLHVKISCYQWNNFHAALNDSNDPMGFLTLYDLARLYVGEDALWRVHSIQREGRKSIPESLLERQDNGHFNQPIPTVQTILAGYSSEKVWDIRSYSKQMDLG